VLLQIGINGLLRRLVEGMGLDTGLGWPLHQVPALQECEWLHDSMPCLELRERATALYTEPLAETAPQLPIGLGTAGLLVNVIIKHYLCAVQAIYPLATILVDAPSALRRRPVSYGDKWGVEILRFMSDGRWARHGRWVRQGWWLTSNATSAPCCSTTAPSFSGTPAPLPTPTANRPPPSTAARHRHHPTLRVDIEVFSVR